MREGLAYFFSASPTPDVLSETGIGRLALKDDTDHHLQPQTDSEQEEEVFKETQILICGTPSFNAAISGLLKDKIKNITIFE